MTEVDTFFDRIHTYTGITHEVGAADGEINPERQIEFFRKIEALASPLKFDEDFEGVLQTLKSDGFDDDDLVTFMGVMRSDDFYRVFGSRVFIYTSEHIEAPEKHAIFWMERIIGGTAVKIVLEYDIAQVELNQNTGRTFPSYEHEIVERRKQKNYTAEQMLMAYLFGLDIPPVNESSKDKSARRQLAKDFGENVFTQVRWARLMNVLDMIALLKELGLTDTVDLNY